jgi:hypothetical protein
MRSTFFLYGGTDIKWMEQFEKKASALANDPFIKETFHRVVFLRTRQPQYPKAFLEQNTKPFLLQV